MFISGTIPINLVDISRYVALTNQPIPQPSELTTALSDTLHLCFFYTTFSPSMFPVRYELISQWYIPDNGTESSDQTTAAIAALQTAFNCGRVEHMYDTAVDATTFPKLAIPLYAPYDNVLYMVYLADTNASLRLVTSHLL